jgi:hypothetical protein
VRAITHGLMTGLITAFRTALGTGEPTALANGNLRE